MMSTQYGAVERVELNSTGQPGVNVTFKSYSAYVVTPQLAEGRGGASSRLAPDLLCAILVSISSVLVRESDSF